MNTQNAISRRWPAGPERAQERARDLRVNVLFTGIPQTLEALRTAAGLAADLGARIVVVVPQVVPYPAPLDSAAVPRAFLVQRLTTAAEESHIDTQIWVCVCRDRQTALSALPPCSIVVIGEKGNGLAIREQKLAAALRRQGHHVVFAGSKGRTDAGFHLLPGLRLFASCRAYLRACLRSRPAKCGVPAGSEFLKPTE